MDHLEKGNDTSWEKVSRWYDTITAEEGHFYQREVILPNLIRLLELEKNSSLLDLGCGQGVLLRALPPISSYVGIDLSPSLIEQARKIKRKEAKFITADILKPLNINEKFSHAVFLLSLQNVERPDVALNECAKHLIDGGSVTIVINHPCFRIPRQSSWGIDESKKLQYRRIDAYFSPLKIPISMQPSKGEKAKNTLSYHFPLSAYFHFLKNASLAITDLEEWFSPKTSEGGRAKMENRARKEFPLFLAIKARKVEPIPIITVR